MATIWNDRRASQRTQVSYRLDAWDPAGSFLGCILDVSTLGVRVLLLEEDVRVDAVKGIRLDLPRWLDLGPCIELGGRFVWCKSRREGGETEAGFSFASVRPAQLRMLELLIAKLGNLQGA